LNALRCFALGVFILASTAIVGSGSAAAQNAAPPSGAILDLNGQPIALVPENFMAEFTANTTITPVSFAFRDDSTYIAFTDASVVDLTSPGGNLLVNGNFNLGVSYPGNGGPLPNDWTYTNISGQPFTGGQVTGCGGGGTQYCWIDGSVQGYDELSQSVPTRIGDQYQVSFTATVFGNLAAWSRVSTNGDSTDAGGNAADILVLAQLGRPPIPEPSTWAMMAIGFAGLAYIGYRRRAAIALD
jgi:hypothetical protein